MIWKILQIPTEQQWWLKQAFLLPSWISTLVYWDERTRYSPKHFQEDLSFQTQTLIVNLIQLPATQPAKFHPLKLRVHTWSSRRAGNLKFNPVLVQRTKTYVSHIHQNWSYLQLKAAGVAGALRLQCINLFISSQVQNPLYALLWDICVTCWRIAHLFSSYQCITTWKVHGDGFRGGTDLPQ